MGTITDDADRYQLLRMVDLQFAISDVVSEYRDLPFGVISNVLSMKAAEVAACSFLSRRPVAEDTFVPDRGLTDAFRVRPHQQEDKANG